jgi:hypothetical protein
VDRERANPNRSDNPSAGRWISSWSFRHYSRGTRTKTGVHDVHDGVQVTVQVDVFSILPSGAKDAVAITADLSCPSRGRVMEGISRMPSLKLDNRNIRVQGSARVRLDILPRRADLISNVLVRLCSQPPS